MEHSKVAQELSKAGKTLRDIKAQIEKQAKDQSRPEALNEDQYHDASLDRS